MPRTARFEELGLPFHVIVQGIERCAIFRDDADRIRFVERAIRVFAKEGLEVIAWALMGNHLHLVVRPTKSRLGKPMQRVLGPYAQEYNRRHDRVGRLFRDRFWSRPVEDDADLLGLIGYVLLNPVRGGIVPSIRELRTYPWTAMRELVAPERRAMPLVDRAATLALFAHDDRSALRELESLMAAQLAADPAGEEHLRDEPGGAASLSTRERIDLRAASVQALRLRDARIDEALQLRDGVTARRIRLQERGWDLEGTIARAAEVCGVAASRLRDGARRHAESRARRLVAYFGSSCLRLPDTEIARATGVARQSVGAARARFLAGGELDSCDWRDFFEVPADEPLSDA